MQNKPIKRPGNVVEPWYQCDGTMDALYMRGHEVENKKTRKQESSYFFLGRFLGREHIFFLFFLTVNVFSWSLSWSRACFLSFFLVFLIIAFLVESVFSCFLTFLFAFTNSHLWILLLYPFEVSGENSLKNTNHLCIFSVIISYFIVCRSLCFFIITITCNNFSLKYIVY